MRIQLHSDVAAFDRRARPLYDADPVRHTMALTTLERACTGRATPAVLLTVERGGETVGAALRVAGQSVLVSALPAVCVTAVDAAAAAVDPEPWGVAGPDAQARAYAAAVTARTGEPAHVAMRQRLFRLVALHRPTRVAGVARRAGGSDLDLLARWQTDFFAEALRALPTPADPRPGLRGAIAAGTGFHVWEVGGVPVALAAASQPVSAMSRIGSVYTPPEHRGHGYGTAVTAAATAWALDAGARDVVLFTDLANPVSNAIYPRIGYRPVADTLELSFGGSR